MSDNVLLEIDENLEPIKNYGWTHNPLSHYNYTINEYRGDAHKKVLNYIFNDNDIKVIYDIGANSGATCDLFIYYSNKYKNKLEKIYLFEPDSDNYKFLQENIKKHRKNLISSFNKGIFYGKKVMDVYLPKMENNEIYFTTGGYCVNPDSLSKNMSKIDKTFELVELEELNLLKPDFIKMDIEGSEINLIKNSVLLKEAKYIYLEWSDKEPFHNVLKKYLVDYDIVFQSPDILLKRKH